MLFNSIDFAIFAVMLYYILVFLNNNIKYQNLFIAFSSYIFYAWWDWRFLSLIFVSTVIDFYVGKKFIYLKLKNKKETIDFESFHQYWFVMFF